MNAALVGLGALSVVLLAGVLLLLLRRKAVGEAGWRGVEARLDRVLEGQVRAEGVLRTEFAGGRQESAAAAKQARDEAAASARELREELAGAIGQLGTSLVTNVGQLGTQQKNQLDSFATQQKGQLDTFAAQLSTLTDSNERRLGELRETVDSRLQQLQQENSQKLDEMRKTVDERLESTLEKRLGESFKQVSERLEAVHKGLGEMQVLAAGVGDLKRVLTNVKTRGTWGEVQLGNLLEQILTPEQYEINVACKPGCAERVEFAIKLPGKDGGEGETVWLPIDAKFPMEDYRRLLDAQEQGDAPGVETARKQLEQQVKKAAVDIRDKYLDPPHTTDFGIMFLPTEGLYAEILTRRGLTDELQMDYRVVVAGPTTLAALLNSLQMGFRTLAIEQRSSEVWQLLGAVKTQFGQFGEALGKVQTKLRQASDTVDQAARKTRTIERKLRVVEELPVDRARGLLAPGLGEEEVVAEAAETLEEAVAEEEAGPEE